MQAITPRLFVLCVALAAGPPAALVAINYDQWFKPKPIDPRLADGEVLFFQANWCGACNSMNPIVARLKDEGFDIRSIDVDSHRQQAIDLRIHSVPTFVLLRDGHEVRRTSGAISAERLRELWR